MKKVMDETIKRIEDNFENYDSGDVGKWISRLVEVQIKLLHNCPPYKDFMKSMEEHEKLKKLSKELEK